MKSNKGMGGTDKIDQFASYYDDRYRSTRWQMRIYFHFLHIATINASILYNDGKVVADQLTLLQFTKLVIKEWCTDQMLTTNVADLDDGPAEGPAWLSRKAWIAAYDRRTTGEHLPEFAEAPGADVRGQCRVCKKKTRYSCRNCGVFLCIGAKNEESCYKAFHTAVSF